MSASSPRTADHPINPIFLERWSPRAFTGEPIPEAELMALFEAARWAPSSYNSQPWRFLYARRDTPAWDVFFGLMGEYNKTWAAQAAALVVLLSKISMVVPGKDVPIESYSHSLDAGSAWGYLALQAAMNGWATHAMVGFDLPRTATELDVPADYRVECMIAVGRRGDPASLPESARAREVPSGRTAIATLVRVGKFVR